MTQMVDIISRLRRSCDEDTRQVHLSDFKRRFLPLAKRLDGNMRYERVDRVRWA